MAAIDLSGVTKRYGELTAVRQLDLTVEEGEIYGFLGPNGAGKSTTINMMLDFVRPTAGEVSVLGTDAQRETTAVRDNIGVLPEGFDVYDRLSGRKHLEFAIDSKDATEDPDTVLERVGLTGDGGRKASEYSTGMKQRLALGMALIDDPDLLILDEPSSGLDPAGAKDMREIVRAEADRGATVFFSSHVLGQVEAVCDRVGILRDGQLVAQDSIEGLRAAVDGSETLTVTVDAASRDDLEAIRTMEGVSGVTTDGGTVTVSCDGDTKTDVITALEASGVTVKNFQTEEASLEELFFAYTEDGTADDNTETAVAAPGEGDR